jgi:hypothetical protein
MERGRFFRHDPLGDANQYQRAIVKILAWHGKTEFPLGAYLGWVQSYEHVNACSFLVNRKNMKLAGIHNMMIGSTKVRATAISRGFSDEELAGLSDEKITAYTRHGISRDALLKLNDFQVRALVSLKRYGLTSADFDAVPLERFSLTHLLALIHCITVEKISAREGLLSMQGLSDDQVTLLPYGVSGSESEGLSAEAVSFLIEAKKMEGLNTPEKVKGLNSNQFDLVKELHDFGMTSDLVRQYDNRCIPIPEFLLLILNGYSVQEILDISSEHTNEQMAAIRQGLAREEVRGLGSFQLHALEKVKTIKNNLQADDLRQANLTSWVHADALDYLLHECDLPAKEALSEIDGMDSEQLTLMLGFRIRRKDLLGLNEWQVRACNNSGLAKAGITIAHFKNNEWFKNDGHYSALISLVVDSYMPIEDALAGLEKLNADQLMVMLKHGMNIQTVTALTDAQRYLLGFVKYGSDTTTVMQATWLQTEEQMSLAYALLSRDFSVSTCLELVEKATGVIDLVETAKKIKAGMSIADLEKEINPAPEEKSCRMM